MPAPAELIARERWRPRLWTRCNGGARSPGGGGRAAEVDQLTDVLLAAIAREAVRAAGARPAIALWHGVERALAPRIPAAPLASPEPSCSGRRGGKTFLAPAASRQLFL